MSAKLPQIKGDRLVNALKERGWYIDRTHGSHIITRNQSKRRTKIVIPVHGKPVKPGTLSNILKDAGLSIEELREIL